MSDDEVEYFKMMEDLFSHPGWRQLIEEAKVQLYQLQADVLDVCKNWDEVNIVKGRAVQLNELIALPRILETVKAQKEAE